MVHGVGLVVMLGECRWGLDGGGGVGGFCEVSCLWSLTLEAFGLSWGLSLLG